MCRSKIFLLSTELLTPNVQREFIFKNLNRIHACMYFVHRAIAMKFLSPVPLGKVAFNLSMSSQSFVAAGYFRLRWPSLSRLLCRVLLFRHKCQLGDYKDVSTFFSVSTYHWLTRLCFFLCYFVRCLQPTYCSF